ncbi:PTPRH phosphatase, partial [Polyodon spathula]|nr:PTPRH phosphatase [Polyodon spathula]
MPGSWYIFSVTTVQADGSRSTAVSVPVYTDPSPPGDIRIDSVGNISISLSWGRPPGMDAIQYTFNITYSSYLMGFSGTINTASNSTVISNLMPGSQYVFNVTTVQAHGSRSTPVSVSVYTNPSPPGDIRVDSVGTNSVSLSWGKPSGMDGILYTFNITYSSSSTSYQISTSGNSKSIIISNLIPGSKYVFSVTTVQAHGSQSTPVFQSLYTIPSPPGEIRIDSVDTNSVSLSWGEPSGMEKASYSFNVTYFSYILGHQGSTIASSNYTVISNLESGIEYFFNVTTVVGNAASSIPDNSGQSTPVSKSQYTKAENRAIITIKYRCSDEPQQCQKIVEEKFRAILGKQLSGMTWSMKILDNRKGN